MYKYSTDYAGEEGSTSHALCHVFLPLPKYTGQGYNIQ